MYVYSRCSFKCKIIYNYKFYYLNFKNERSLLLYIAKVMHAAAASIEIVLETANVVIDKDCRFDCVSDGEGAAEFDPPAIDASNAFFPAASISAAVAFGLDFLKSALALSLASLAFVSAATFFKFLITS